MVTPTCPKCKQAILSEDVNVANDVAYCRACNLSHPLSALTRGAELDENIDPGNPPAGAWQTNDGMGCVIGANHRSIGTAIGALAFGLFWNGILSVFLCIAIAGTLRNLGLPIPHWFPAPIMNGSPMGVGMTIFLWLFLTPFILVGLFMIGMFLSCVAGRMEVRINNPEGVVFTRIGALGYRRRFVTSAVKEVRVEDRSWRDSDGDRQRKTYIVIETREGKQLKFGSMLTEERRKFVAGALRRVLPV
jgi:membrane protein implicated in regulation of membrane protease activity